MTPGSAGSLPVGAPANSGTSAGGWLERTLAASLEMVGAGTAEQHEHQAFLVKPTETRHRFDPALGGHRQTGSSSGGPAEAGVPSTTFFRQGGLTGGRPRRISARGQARMDQAAGDAPWSSFLCCACARRRWRQPGLAGRAAAAARGGWTGEASLHTGGVAALAPRREPDR